MPKKSKESHTSSHLEDTIMKNLVELQKVHADLAEKFDSLTKQLSHLLALFEVAARNFAKNAPVGEYEKDKEFLEKIDRLLDQNKTIAKGLSLMEERLRQRMYGPQEEIARREIMPQEKNISRPLPRF